jgi:hypothetical protein
MRRQTCFRVIVLGIASSITAQGRTINIRVGMSSFEALRGLAAFLGPRSASRAYRRRRSCSIKFFSADSELVHRPAESGAPLSARQRGRVRSLV